LGKASLGERNRKNKIEQNQTVLSRKRGRRRSPREDEFSKNQRGKGEEKKKSKFGISWEKKGNSPFREHPSTRKREKKENANGSAS